MVLVNATIISLSDERLVLEIISSGGALFFRPDSSISDLAGAFFNKLQSYSGMRNEVFEALLNLMPATQFFCDTGIRNTLGDFGRYR